MRTSTWPHQMVRNVTTASIGPAICSPSGKVILETPPLAQARSCAVLVPAGRGRSPAQGAIRVRSEQPMVHALLLVGHFDRAPDDAAPQYTYYRGHHEA